MRTLKFKAQPTNAFFATVSCQMFGGSSQLPTNAESCSYHEFYIHELHELQKTKLNSGEEKRIQKIGKLISYTT